MLQVSEWSVDYNVPGGTDKEGWQYAADFPVYVTTFSQHVVSQKKHIIKHYKKDVTFISLMTLMQDVSWPQNHERLC